MILDPVITRIDGTQECLAACRGKALLLVNTASGCGFTKQVAGLQELYRRITQRGLVVMGFPCNEWSIRSHAGAR